MWKHFCIVPMSIWLLICIKLVGTRHWFGSIPVNLLVWDESMKVRHSDKLASFQSWTKVISNANKISHSVQWACFWCVFGFKVGTSLTQNYTSTFAMYLKTSVNPLPLPKVPKPPNSTTPHTHPPCPAVMCLKRKKGKATLPQTFPLKGQILQLCKLVPYWFPEDNSHLLHMQCWPKMLPLGKFSVFLAGFIPVFSSEMESVRSNQLLFFSVSCGAISICVCASSISPSIYNYTTRAWLGGQ